MEIFFTLFYQPLANLIFWGTFLTDQNFFWLGLLLAVIVVKLILLPLHNALMKTQVKMQFIQKDLENLKKQKNISKEKQAQKIMELYKKNGINPFSPIFILLLQIPVYIAIFFIIRDFVNNMLRDDVLYSFLRESIDPTQVEATFFSIDLSLRGGILIAISVMATQFFYMKISDKIKKTKQTPGQEKFKKALLVIVAVASFFIEAALGIYWIFNNLLSIVFEILFAKRVSSKTKAQ